MSATHTYPITNARPPSVWHRDHAGARGGHHDPLRTVMRARTRIVAAVAALLSMVAFLVLVPSTVMLPITVVLVTALFAATLIIAVERRTRPFAASGRGADNDVPRAGARPAAPPAPRTREVL